MSAAILAGLFTLVAPNYAQEATNPNSGPVSSAQEVVEPNRIALTPQLDAAIMEGEWDPFAASADAETFLQWEPGILHVAARNAVDRDIVVSVDLSGNGWLIGNDNLEFRVIAGSGGKVLARRLDASNVNGPVWVPIPGFTESSQVKSAAGTIEASIVDPGLGILPSGPTNPSIRIDAAPTGAMEVAAFLPRVLTPVRLGFSRSSGFPENVRFQPEGANRSVVTGQFLRIRYTFEGKADSLKGRIAMSAEGLARNATNSVEMPFPGFDRRGRAFVDFDTNVQAGVPVGYYLSRAVVASADNLPAVAQVSFRIADPVDADVVTTRFAASSNDRSLGISVNANSNSANQTSGRMTLTVPEPLRVLNGGERRIIINSRRGRSRSDFSLFVPTGVSGTFPLTFHFDVDGRKYDQVRFITITPGA